MALKYDSGEALLSGSDRRSTYVAVFIPLRPRLCENAKSENPSGKLPPIYSILRLENGYLQHFKAGERVSVVGAGANKTCNAALPHLQKIQNSFHTVWTHCSHWATSSAGRLKPVLHAQAIHQIYE